VIEFDFSPAARFLESLAGKATPTQIALQVGIAIAAWGLAWLLARAVVRRTPDNPRWKFGEGGFDRVLFPLFMLLFVWIGRLVLAPHQRIALLDIVLALAIAMVLIRLAVYVLGIVLPKGAFLRSVVRGIAWIAWIAVALHLVGLLTPTVEALDSAAITMGKNQQRVSLLLVLQALAALALTLTVAMWVARITESRVLASESMEMSMRMVVTKIVRVAAFFLAILIALPMVGIDVTALSVFGGALGVGLGFGLQKIASNYVSGFIVLLDRSLRIGDIITVDNRRGQVEEIATRFTVLKGADGVESIIPNELLITQSVNHHTYSDPKVSVVIPVRVTYESDVERALELMREAAAGMPQVLAEPAPTARVKQLGDQGVELELTLWMPETMGGEGDLRSEILRRIIRGYRESGIVFARRDLRPIATPETTDSSGKATA
jgi:small-conductance mechanosensitive channel